MCFSATVNFAGSAVLGNAEIVTLTKVKHRRELLFAALPLLFAIHLLLVRAVDRYAFTSVWCAYAAAASVVILAYFWRSHEGRDHSATGSGAGYNLSSFEPERHVRLGPVIPLWAEFTALF